MQNATALTYQRTLIVCLVLSDLCDRMNVLGKICSFMGGGGGEVALLWRAAPLQVLGPFWCILGVIYVANDPKFVCLPWGQDSVLSIVLWYLDLIYLNNTLAREHDEFTFE